MEGFEVVFEHAVLFRDLDAMGHVNNVSFVAFMEDARVEYWRALRKDHGLKGINFILAEVTCTYVSPAHFGETLLIGIRARNLGNKSFHFEYRMEELTSARLVNEGKSVQVMYDYEKQQSMPLDERMRKAVSELEQLRLEELSSGKTLDTRQ